MVYVLNQSQLNIFVKTLITNWQYMITMKGANFMFGKKQRIIETQAALIADLKEENEFLTLQVNSQRKIIVKQQMELSKLYMMLSSDKASNIDFPNSQKGGSDSTGAVNVSDILQH